MTNEPHLRDRVQKCVKPSVNRRQMPRHGSKGRRGTQAAGGRTGSNGSRHVRATSLPHRPCLETQITRHRRGSRSLRDGELDADQSLRGWRTDIARRHPTGDRARTPLLLFNGIGANVELAGPLMRELDGIETVVFDVPGVGGSPLLALPYWPSTVARWAAELMRQRGYNKVDVAGVSWGGGMAQQFAHQYPAICRRLILAATGPGAIMVPGKLSVLWKMASPRRYVDRKHMHSIAAEFTVEVSA